MKRLLLIGLLGLPAFSTPLHLELYFYEGTEFTCHMEKSRVWYDFAGKKLGDRPLTPKEIQEVESALRLQRFQELPPKMIQATVDSSQTLTVWQGKKFKAVQATNPYEGPLKADFMRFQTILKVIERVAPVPGAEIERLRRQAR